MVCAGSSSAPSPLNGDSFGDRFVTRNTSDRSMGNLSLIGKDAEIGGHQRGVMGHTQNLSLNQKMGQEKQKFKSILRHIRTSFKKKKKYARYGDSKSVCYYIGILASYLDSMLGPKAAWFTHARRRVPLLGGVAL